MGPPGIIGFMNHPPAPSSRTLTVVLSESEWRAFRAVEPDAVGWLQERIRERLGSTGVSDSKGSGAVSPSRHTVGSSWGEDQY